MSYNEVFLYYFSGTGNAKHCAETFAEEVRKQNTIVHLCNIAQVKSIVFPEPNTQTPTLIGFFSPTHGFNLPPIMLEFMSNFPKTTNPNAKAFVLNTRAGMMIWKLFTPGLSGVALMLGALLMRIKGYKIKGLKPIDLPSNWLSIHPALNTQTAHLMTAHWDKKVKQFSNRILSGKGCWRGLWDIPLDLLIMPISILYYLMGRFFLAKTFFASYQCTDCGLCSKQCPVNAIVKKGDILYWKFRCESCMKCMNYCPANAIHTSHGFSILLWIFGGTYLPILLLKVAHHFIDFNITFVDTILDYIISPLLFFVVIFYAYNLFHFMLRFKWFNYLVTFTSLTRLPFWGRYKYKA